MTKIEERRYLQCPYARAKTALQDELHDVASGDSTLRLTLPIGKGNSTIDLAKDVDVTLAPTTDPMHFDEPWRVAWAPHGGGPYPQFEGVLSIRADEDWNTAAIELAGAYEPPYGAAGKAFDAIAGSRIAQATARTLLERIGNRIEERFRREEAEKHAS